ncbi:uncharacterized protein KY384_004740 [Bacidia gigantensis]|uniref:uncharacterized protein n=1 Tax=Bacidia gigantensis TaxID=2732470 RepID=UPI001D03AED2|nr:uncharacterized protein KY384_004740 [Bacidia gigantensis]KAG8530240.1 hypothetical protein KY384_004740 [Bacidia gigantensis]
MSSLFCCDSPQPYPRASRTDHDSKFSPFMTAALGNALLTPAPRSLALTSPSNDSNTDTTPANLDATNPNLNTDPEGRVTQYPYIIQFVKQINHGPIEAKRYFAPSPNSSDSNITTAAPPYVELAEADLISASFAKVNTYKNYRCLKHNRFFELNLYEKDPSNKHHWRADVARPAGDIDLLADRIGQ